MTEKPRVGPWLRRYSSQPKRTWRDRLPELALGLGATAAFAAVLVGVLWAFLRWPIYTLGGLVAVWLVGLLILMVKRRRERASERARRGAADDFGR